MTTPEKKPFSTGSIADEFLSRRFGIYILGAGFSHRAGIPLAAQLWPEVQRRALALQGRAESFKEDLEAYVRYRKVCDGVDLTFQEVNFEEFVAFLDIEHYLGLRGKDTWSSDGNETQVVIKTLIGEILSETTPQKGKIPDLYLQFAKLLKPPDYVLTFNYDVLLERSLEVAGVPFRLFPDRYKKGAGGVMLVDDSKEEVVILKLHGSIDWFNRSHKIQLENLWRQQGLNTTYTDMVFSHMEELDVVPLVDGPRDPDDPLREMYRVRNVEQLYGKHPMFHVTPSLLNPSTAKILYSQMLRDFWWGLGGAGILNFAMAIIGFSLPPQDEYARQVIYRLVRNYQKNYWDHPTFNHKKRPLVMIDYRKLAEQEEEFRKRYAFVDWSKAITYFDGFDEKAIALLSK